MTQMLLEVSEAINNSQTLRSIVMLVITFSFLSYLHHGIESIAEDSDSSLKKKKYQASLDML